MTLLFSLAAFCAFALNANALLAQPAHFLTPPERVLIIVNDKSPVSQAIAKYYAERRAIPAKNVCHIHATTDEEIERNVFEEDIFRPIAACLKKNNLLENVYYIVTTLDVPLKIGGPINRGTDAEYAAVDSELTLLYTDIKSGMPHALKGPLPNPFFGRRERPFSHEEFPMYLVTRLAAYDLAGVKAMIDRSLLAANRGKFVFDLHEAGDEPGDNWLRDAAIQIPKERVVLEETSDPIYDQNDVIGYASWGSNDAHHKRRYTGFHWLPGAIMTEYVSSDARTFKRPPETWVPSRDWGNRSAWFLGAPQSLSADYILEGATGASGHTYEPYLQWNPRPDLIFPAYYSGRNLAESYYLGLPVLSWQNVIVGDPLCSLGKIEH